MGRSEHSKRIDEELVSVDALARHLKRRCGCRNVQVKREDDDPPDFWSDIDGQIYAVEVTSIVTGQGYHAACLALREAVGNTTREQGVLSGTYTLIIMPASPTFRAELLQVARACCNGYILHPGNHIRGLYPRVRSLYNQTRPTRHHESQSHRSRCRPARPHAGQVGGRRLPRASASHAGSNHDGTEEA